MIVDSASAYLYAVRDSSEQVSVSNGTVTYLVADSLGSVYELRAEQLGCTQRYRQLRRLRKPQTIGGLTARAPFYFAGGQFIAASAPRMWSRRWRWERWRARAPGSSRRPGMPSSRRPCLGPGG